MVITFSILNFTNPKHSVSGILRRMRDFASEADVPTSEFCWLRIALLLGPSNSGTVTVASVPPMGKDVGMKELSTATGVSEILARGVHGAATSFEAAFGIVFSPCGNSSGSRPACGR